MRLVFTLFIGSLVTFLMTGFTLHSQIETDDLFDEDVQVSQSHDYSEEFIVFCEDIIGKSFSKISDIDRDECLFSFWTEDMELEAIENSDNNLHIDDGLTDQQKNLLGDLGSWPEGIDDVYSLKSGALFSRRSADDGSGTVPFFCSGSSVKAGEESMVVTAGHCIHEGRNGDFHTEVIFVPNYDPYRNLRDTHGRYKVEQLFVLDGWVDHGERDPDAASPPEASNSDVGMGIPRRIGYDFYPSLREMVGGYDIAFDQSLEFNATVIGYPALRHWVPEPPRRMLSCAGDTSLYIFGGVFDQYLGSELQNCSMDYGASGGAWLSDFDEQTGEGVLRSISVNSIVTDDGDYSITSPRFQDDVERMYKHVSRLMEEP